MRTFLDCFPCIMNQALRTGRITTNDEHKIKQLLDEIGASFKDLPLENTPVESGAIIYSKIREITGVVDPYKKIKEESIRETLALYPRLKKLVINAATSGQG